MTNANEDPLNHFLDGVGEQLSDEEEPPWLVYGPRWAQEGRGASKPPDNLDDPVWAPSAGWMEASSAPIGETDGPLALYAPDSNEELK